MEVPNCAFDLHFSDYYESEIFSDFLVLYFLLQEADYLSIVDTEVFVSFRYMLQFLFFIDICVYIYIYIYIIHSFIYVCYARS